MSLLPGCQKYVERTAFSEVLGNYVPTSEVQVRPKHSILSERGVQVRPKHSILSERGAMVV